MRANHLNLVEMDERILCALFLRGSSERKKGERHGYKRTRHSGENLKTSLYSKDIPLHLQKIANKLIELWLDNKPYETANEESQLQRQQAMQTNRQSTESKSVLIGQQEKKNSLSTLVAIRQIVSF
jgi:hypothetical protein